MRYLGLLLLLGFFTSCNDGGSAVPTSQSSKSIVGSWDWVRSEGGFRGETITPATEGYTQRYTFREDCTYVQIQTNTKDGLIASTRGQYKLKWSLNRVLMDTEWTIDLRPSGVLIDTFVSMQRFQMPSKDTILLGDNRADGIMETYARTQ